MTAKGVHLVDVMPPQTMTLPLPNACCSTPSIPYSSGADGMQSRNCLRCQTCCLEAIAEVHQLGMIVVMSCVDDLHDVSL